MHAKILFTLIFSLFLSACSADKEPALMQANTVAELPAAESADEFVQRIQAEMQLVARESETAAWVRNT